MHPVREEVDKLIGSYNLTAIVNQDNHTLETMGHIEGLISFLCVLKNNKDGRVLAEGRGSSVINQNNKYVSRAVHSAFNSSIVDAVMRSTKVLDTFRGPSKNEVEEAYKARDMAEEGATEKQISYLRQLIQTNVEDDHDRDRWESQLADMSKRDAGQAIESFLR